MTDLRTKNRLGDKMFEIKPAPTNDRPCRFASAEGPEEVVETSTHRIVYRQIGWHGQTGRFYSLEEDPSKFEYGSFSPMWIIAHSDRIVTEDDTSSGALAADPELVRKVLGDAWVGESNDGS